MLSQTRLSPPGTALVHAPENAVPAPGTDDGIAKDEGRGTESATDASEEAPTDLTLTKTLTKNFPQLWW